MHGHTNVRNWKILTKGEFDYEPTLLMYVYELRNIVLCAIANLRYESISR
jgi:hypothetical protein